MTPLRRLALLAGLLLAGEGLLVASRIVDHEAPLALGWAALLAGCSFIVWSSFARRNASRERASRADRDDGTTVVPGRSRADVRGSDASSRRALVVAALGFACLLGIIAYNVARNSDLSPPELAILLYGAALVAAAPHLSRRVRGDITIGKLVAYSFPLALAPLSLFALAALLAAGATQGPLTWFLERTLVAPMAGVLAVLGLGVRALGQTVLIETPRGNLFLTVGMVCSGLYAMALFMGVFALFAWEQKTPPRRLALYLLVGLVGLHVANVLRLVLLAWVGYQWGGPALMSFHEHAGWVLFVAWGVLFWWLVLRRFEGPARPRLSA